MYYTINFDSCLSVSHNPLLKMCIFLQGWPHFLAWYPSLWLPFTNKNFGSHWFSQLISKFWIYKYPMQIPLYDSVTFHKSKPLFKKKSSRRFLVETSKHFIVVTFLFKTYSFFLIIHRKFITVMPNTMKVIIHSTWPL